MCIPSADKGIIIEGLPEYTMVSGTVVTTPCQPDDPGSIRA